MKWYVDKWELMHNKYLDRDIARVMVLSFLLYLEILLNNDIIIIN